MNHLDSAKEPRRIFVGSMTDLFGDWVPDEWLAAVFGACHENPRHVYMFLTKNPKRYAALEKSGLLPEGENYWWGMSVTKTDANFYAPTGRNSFVSIEPMLGAVTRTDVPESAKWLILGAETGNRKGKTVPKREWIDYWRFESEHGGAPIFLKDSLADIWGEPLIQEYPAAMTEYIAKAKEAQTK
jgi:protein gp37